MLYGHHQRCDHDQPEHETERASQERDQRSEHSVMKVDATPPVPQRSQGSYLHDLIPDKPAHGRVHGEQREQQEDQGEQGRHLLNLFHFRIHLVDSRLVLAQLHGAQGIPEYTLEVFPELITNEVRPSCPVDEAKPQLVIGNRPVDVFGAPLGHVRIAIADVIRHRIDVGGDEVQVFGIEHRTLDLKGSYRHAEIESHEVASGDAMRVRIVLVYPDTSVPALGRILSKGLARAHERAHDLKRGVIEGVHVKGVFLIGRTALGTNEQRSGGLAHKGKPSDLFDGILGKSLACSVGIGQIGLLRICRIGFGHAGPHRAHARVDGHRHRYHHEYRKELRERCREVPTELLIQIPHHKATSSMGTGASLSKTESIRPSLRRMRRCAAGATAAL